MVNVAVVPDDVVGRFFGDDLLQAVLLEARCIALQGAEVLEVKPIVELLELGLLRLRMPQVVGEGDDASRCNNPRHLIHHLLSVLTVAEAIGGEDDVKRTGLKIIHAFEVRHQNRVLLVGKALLLLSARVDQVLLVRDVQAGHVVEPTERFQA